MSEVKKIATRESYGNALVELGKEQRSNYKIIKERKSHLYRSRRSNE